MTSPEQIPLPEKNQKEDPLVKLRGFLEKKSEPPEEPKKESISMKKMNKFKEFLAEFDLDGFIKMFSLEDRLERMKSNNEKPDKYDMDYLEGQAELENSFRDFLDAKDNLDSESKRKLWNQIYKESWLKKLDMAFQELQYELEKLELTRISNKKSRHMEKGEPAQLTDGEENILRYGAGATIKNRVGRIATGLQALKSFGFDEQRLRKLEDRFKKVKK